MVDPKFAAAAPGDFAIDGDPIDLKHDGKLLRQIVGVVFSPEIAEQATSSVNDHTWYC